MKNFLKIATLVSLFLLCWQPAQAAQTPAEPALFDTILSSPLSSGGTTMYLQSPTTTQTTALSGFNCFTVDVDTSNLEYVCGTVSGSTVTGLTRNVDYFTGTTTNGSVSTPSHRTGADVRITDFPFVQILHNIFAGLETISSVLHYASGTTISSSDSQAIPNVAYVNSVAIAGAPNSSETVNGIAQLATGVQAASTTSTGSTGARLVIPASLATSSNDVAGLHSVMTQNNGYINWNMLDLTKALTWTGLQTYSAGFIDNASSTFTSTLNAGAANFSGTANFTGTVTGTFPVTRYVTASTTPTLSKNNGYATSSSFYTIAAGLLSASSTIDVYGDWSCAQSNTTQSGCHLYISDNLGNKLLDMQVSFGQNNNQTLDCAFHAEILFNNSVASEIVLGQSSGAEQVNSATTLNACPTNLVSTASLNYANAQQLGFVVRGNDSNGTATLNNFAIVVNR